MLRLLKQTNYIPALTFKRGFFTVVPQSSIYFRELLGHTRTKLNPGIHLYLPAVHKLHKIEMREEGKGIHKISCYTSDNVPVEASGTLFYKVFDPELACYNTVNYRDAVVTTGESAIRSIIGRFSYDEITRQRNGINEELVNCIGDSIKGFGVRVTRVEIQEFKPSNAGVQKQLELQLEAERKRRQNELETLAKIRTAEGKKTEDILLSEAESISAKNLADAEKYVIETKTKAIVDQINCIKEACSNNLEIAINYLIEVKKIEEFGKIHSSPNKEIVYVDPQSIVPNAKSHGDYINKNL